MNETKHAEINCRCGHNFFTNELETFHTVEQFHPLNRGKEPHHITTVLRCPLCKKWYYADGKYLG